MRASDCGDPAFCPVPDPTDVDLRPLPSVVLAAGTPLRRGHQRRYSGHAPAPAVTQLPAAHQMSRFAPMIGAAHAYVARRETAALLESVLHDVIPDAPRVRWPRLAIWALSHVTLSRDVRLVDLRDPTLAALGVERHQLVATDPSHYPCTRQWAQHLHGRAIGGQPTAGLLWHSRQAELHAHHGTRPLVADLLVGEQAEVAVLWTDIDDDTLLQPTGGPWPLEGGHGHELVRDVATLLGAPPPLAGPQR